MKTVLCTHWVHDEVRIYLSDHFQVLAPENRGEIWSRQEILQKISDVVAIVTSMADHIDEAFLDQCPSLKIVSATLKGYDNYDLEACTKRKIWLSIVPDTIIAPTAELAVALTLSLMRNVRQGDEIVRKGEYQGWLPKFYGKSLANSIVGLIGYGHLGRTIASLLVPFGPSKLFIVDRDNIKGQDDPDLFRHFTIAEQVDLSELASSKCDVIILAVPLSKSTHHMIDASFISQLQIPTYMVNVGRGSTVDELAILAALSDGKLAGYAADVFEMEDWALSTRPKEILKSLREHSNTIFTPHLGSATDTIRREMSMTAAKQVVQALKGEKPTYALNSF